MKLHLVGGFLGSGKTTAIIHAVKAFMDRGLQVGVITNDQGKYLVDTAFFRLASIPAVEVTGGCFCCNYDDLEGRLAELVAAARPDVVFAESVGSCADIVATVVKPLLALGKNIAMPASFSVFADARLLRRRLLEHEMPFSEDVIYIFDQQIKEAGLVVVNKADLLSEMALEDIQALLREHYPQKPFLIQSSLSISGVLPWMELIQSGELDLPQNAIEMDYQRYGAGEEKLAWLDEQIELTFPDGQGREKLLHLISIFSDRLRAQGAGIGHLKFIIQTGAVGEKISIPALEEPDWQERVSDIPGSEVTLLINARVEMPAERLSALLHSVLEETGLAYRVQSEDSFHPKQPNPTHRIT